MKSVSVAVIGASGYSGEELVRILLSHPHARLTSVTSRQYSGRTVAEVFPRFAQHPQSRETRFTEPDVGSLATAAEVVFLALPHGVSLEFAAALLDRGRRVIDLSADFRLRSASAYREFYGQDHGAPGLLKEAVYGLPEVYREEIRAARLVASPGCYPTSILLPLLPLVRSGLIETDAIVADALSGVSGAGRKLEAGYLYCECNESLRAYGVPKHRHLSEIEEQLSLAAGRPVVIQFTPHLVPVNRGILSTLYLAPTRSAAGDAAAEFERAVARCYQTAYGTEPFIRLLDQETLPDTKNVVGTNCLELAWRVDPRTGRLIVLSAEDNVIKGAGGQAVQCLNLMCGFPETAGLV